MNIKEKAEILDTCLERISQGENPETVLSDYPGMRNDLSLLFGTARSISGIPRVVPSKEFVSTSKTQLLRRIYCEAHSTNGTTGSVPSRSFADSLKMLLTPRRLSTGLALTLAIVLLVFVGQFTFFKPAPAVAASCYLRILSGEVSIQAEPDGEFATGTDGMTVDEGSIVTTAEDSHALLAFFDGSTIKLESGTTLELIRIENNKDESPVIVLKQWLGRTWSRVEKMTDSESRYEIETPSATAVVRGTLFATEVTGNGETSVATTEGLVSVFGENEEVFVPPSNKTTVKKGNVPSMPSLFQNISEIRIITEGSVVGSINDPSGSSTGTLPDGTTFNQITGSVLTAESGNRQVITLTEPSSGDYNLVLRYLESNSARFTIEGIYEGETVFTYSDSLDTTDGQGIIVNFGLTAKQGNLDFGKVKYQLMDDESPEKLVDTSDGNHDNKPVKDAADTEDIEDTAKGSGTSAEEVKKSTGKESAPGQSKTDNTGNDNSTSNSDKKSDQTEDIGDTKDTEDTVNNGKSDTAGNNDNSGSSNNSVSGNANNSDTGGNPGNSDKSDNVQKDKTGDEPDKPGNSGNSDNNGNLKDPDDKDAVESEKDSGKDNKEDKSNNGKAKGKSDESDNTTGNSTGKKNINLKHDD